MALSYFINRKKAMCVITLQGSLTSNDVEVLSACLKEAVLEPARNYILNMGGLKDVEPDASRAFTLFQQGLRGNSRLYLCDLNDKIGRMLRAGGIIRESEIFSDLMAVLQAILNEEK